DRTYQDDGSLTPRSSPNAMIEDETQSIRQVAGMALYGKVKTVTNKNISVKADTVCIHADGPHALLFAKNIHQTLTEKGIELKPVQK
ncbi:MAG: LamB/YcsF family protein, partial [Bacteroidota bacterium]